MNLYSLEEEKKYPKNNKIHPKEKKKKTLSKKHKRKKSTTKEYTNQSSQTSKATAFDEPAVSSTWRFPQRSPTYKTNDRRIKRMTELKICYSILYSLQLPTVKVETEIHTVNGVKRINTKKAHTLLHCSISCNFFLRLGKVRISASGNWARPRRWMTLLLV